MLDGFAQHLIYDECCKTLCVSFIYTALHLFTSRLLTDAGCFSSSRQKYKEAAPDGVASVVPLSAGYNIFDLITYV
jgi:hypothetical protein